VVSQFQDGNLTTNANREGLNGASFSITTFFLMGKITSLPKVKVSSTDLLT
jgi:hypothetical protein